LSPGLDVTCLDLDSEAIADAERVLDRLDDSWGCTLEIADARTYDYSSADLVMLAALVGQSEESKFAVLDRIGRSAPPHAVVAARTVPSDGRQLLYRRIDPGDVPRSLSVLGEHHPPPGVVNSLLVMSPAARSR
jgi:hypothetical protein